MGTRHLIMVKLNGKTKVAQYGQWDGYPTGQGADIASFIQSKRFDLAAFKKAVSELTFMTKKESEGFYESDAVKAMKYDDFCAKYPELSRDTGAKLLPLIQKGGIGKLVNSSDFIKDSLFCEWAYEIDLTKKCVNVYRGFQATGKTETVKRADGSTYTREKYARCKLAKRIAFKDFTVKRMKTLEEEICGKDEE